MAQPGHSNTGMSGGKEEGSILIGQQNQGQNRDQRIQAGTIGNVATGDNHGGQMTATVGPQMTEALDPTKATSKDVLKLLKQEECDGKTIAIFEEKRINGRMLLRLDEGDLNQYGLTDEDEKNRLLGIIDDVKNGTLKLN